MASSTYDDDEKLVDGDFKVLEINHKSHNLSFWVSVRRYIGSLFIYLIYWLTIWGALKQVVGATLSPEKAKELVENGVINSVWGYGWGNHYVWFLIALCLTTYCSAILAGATAKKKGAVVGGIVNLPIVVFLSIFCFSLYTSQIEVENQLSWKIVSAISILGSLFFSIAGGLLGEKWQNSTFKSNTIFGIRPVHWWWLIFPLYFVIQELVPKIVATLGFLFGSTLIEETKYSVLLFLIFVAFATFIYFIMWGWFKTFRLLSLEHKTNLGKFRIVLSVLFYLWGIPLLFDVFCILIYILFR